MTSAQERRKPELPVSQYAARSPGPKRLRLLGPWRESRHPGIECADACGAVIRQGDLTCSDGEGGWLCVSCGQL